MRKVWISFMAVAALTVAMALPAAAAVPGGKSCNNSWNWSFGSGPAITQPTVPSIPGNCAQAKSATAITGSKSSKLNFSQIMQQLQAQFGSSFNGLPGGSSCPSQNANFNQ